MGRQRYEDDEDDFDGLDHPEEDDEYSDDWDQSDEQIFADPGSNSSLRAATENNPRDRPCPNCGEENVLTRHDVQLGYQCNRCADRQERGCD